MTILGRFTIIICFRWDRMNKDNPKQYYSKTISIYEKETIEKYDEHIATLINSIEQFLLSTIARLNYPELTIPYYNLMNSNNRKVISQNKIPVTNKKIAYEEIIRTYAELIIDEIRPYKLYPM